MMKGIVVWFAILALAYGVHALDIAVDVGKSTGELVRLWQEGMGSGHASLTMRSDWREAATRAAMDAGIKRFRWHGIWDDDMSTYLDGNVNMVNVFNSYDFLLSLGVRPLVEMSFMPEMLASNTSLTVMHYKGGISPPLDFQKLETFASTFVSALVTRYGESEVNDWIFEVWNEFNCGFYDIPHVCGPTAGNASAYFQLYDTLSKAVVSAGKMLQVGGPATAQLAYINATLAHAASSGSRLSYITSHLYPTDPNVARTRQGYEEALMQATLDAKRGGKDLWLTETNAGLGIGVLDTSYAAAFLGHVALISQTLAPQGLRMISYWCVSDVFEEQGMVPTEFHDGFGIRTVHGIAKPVARAFEELAAIGDTLLSVSTSSSNGRLRNHGITVGSIDAFATMNKTSNEVDVVLINFQPRGILPNASTETITLMFLSTDTSQMPTASITRIDDTTVTPRQVWIDAGSPTYPSQDLLDKIDAASQIHVQSLPLQKDQHGNPTATITIPPDAFYRVNLIM